jgi:hypothetical protein
MVESMGSILRVRACDVQLARIEFTDPRDAERLAQSSLRQEVVGYADLIVK